MSESVRAVDPGTYGVMPVRRANSAMESTEHASALDREWARRRQEVFGTLEGSIQQAMGTVMQASSQVLAAATEIQQDMEREARIVLLRLEEDRRRVVEEIADGRRTRDRINAEVEAIARRAEDEAGRIRDGAHAEAMRITRGAHEDAGRIRRTAGEEAQRMLRQASDESATLRQQAQQEHATLLRDAEERKSQLMAEIRQLEQQFSSVSERMQSILGRPMPAGAQAERPRAQESRREDASTDEPPGWMRREDTRAAEQASPRPSVAPRATFVEEAAPPVPITRAPSWAPSAGPQETQTIREVESEPVRSWAAPATAHAEAPAAQPRWAPDLSGEPGDPTEVSPSSTSDARTAVSQDAPAASVAVQARPTESPPQPTPVAAQPSAAPRPNREPVVAAARVEMPVAPAPTPRGEPASEAMAAAGGRSAVRLAIANTPNLGRALEVQRSIQRAPGVRDVRALQFERGVLVLNVEHDSNLDIASEIRSLPSVALEEVSHHDDLIEFRFPSN
jgi:cell division septum initiation protein DivIVA